MPSSLWPGRRVFLTGHTGFKGGWLAVWLEQRGATVFGYGLAPEEHSFYNAARLAGRYAETVADLRDLAAVQRAMAAADPHIVVHMAAQPLVRASFSDPVGTFATNVLGTVHLLEAARQCTNLLGIVAITTDKVYRNQERLGGYSEADPLGGHDPYSASKAGAEHACDAYRASFFAGGRPLLATARAGNVIGGGDWSTDRLVPDLVRAFGAGTPARIRAPNSVRPWQHVLEPLAGYLTLAERMLEGDRSVADSWNFGPWPDTSYRVAEVADLLVGAWGAAARWEQDGRVHPDETKLLSVDPAKAHERLGWRPLLAIEESVRLTVDWYRAVGAGADALALTQVQIARYEELMAAPATAGRRRRTGA